MVSPDLLGLEALKVSTSREGGVDKLLMEGEVFL